MKHLFCAGLFGLIFWGTISGMAAGCFLLGYLVASLVWEQDVGKLKEENRIYRDALERNA